VSAIRTKTALLALALLAPAVARGEGVGLRHLKSVYLDDKDGPLRLPEGVACDDRGALVVADTGNGRLLLYEWKNGALTGGRPLKLAQLSYPVRVQIDSKGNVLVLDRKVRRIGRVDARGEFGGYLDLAGASGPAPVPTAFKLDASDNAHVLDVAGARVLVLDGTGSIAREIPLPPGTEVTDIAVDAGGRIYAMDAIRATLWVAEKGGKAFKPLGASLKDRMSFPGYLTVNRGRIFVVDQNGDGLVELGHDGAYQGRELALGWTDGLLYYPGQICIDGRGDTFVADRQNNRVQIFGATR